MMNNDDQSLTFTQTVDVAPAAVYRAFTNVTAVQSWLCDHAEVDAREKGRLYLHWNQGYYSSGEFVAVEPETSLAFTWFGRGEIAPTKVDVSLKARNEGTEIELVHSGIGAGEAWQQTRVELKKGWETGLANLKSVLEQGLDKRIYDRPLLGVYIAGVVDEKVATKLGVPVTSGIQISGVAPGAGAEAAGLQADDVIFELGTTELTSFEAMRKAITPYEAGDEVEVLLYRGSEKLTLSMELSRRPVPDVPVAAADFASALSRIYRDLDAELDELLMGVSEEEASKTDDGDWNAKQVLAHLIATERTMHLSIALQISGQAPSRFPGDIAALFDSLTAVYPTLLELTTAWKQAEAETVALVKRLPDAFVSRKLDYLNLGNLLLVGLPGHTRNHFNQIRRALTGS